MQRKQKNYLVFLYEKEEKYADVVKVSERAIRLINSGRNFQHLADFYYQKIKAQEKLYRSKREWEEKRNQLIEECNHIYYVYMVEDLYITIRLTTKGCREIDSSEQGML